jgi:biopolymer transport protein ExbD
MRRRGPADIHANLTPMIDVTFLLIVFFVLVSQIVEVENVELELPELPDPASAMAGEEQRVVVNVVPALDGTARAYRTGGVSFPADADGAIALGAAIERRFASAPNLRVSFRADRRTEHASIQPALDAIANAARRAGAAPRLNLVILREET